MNDYEKNIRNLIKRSRELQKDDQEETTLDNIVPEILKEEVILDNSKLSKLSEEDSSALQKELLTIIREKEGYLKLMNERILINKSKSQNGLYIVIVGIILAILSGFAIGVIVGIVWFLLSIVFAVMYQNNFDEKEAELTELRDKTMKDYDEEIAILNNKIQSLS